MLRTVGLGQISLPSFRAFNVSVVDKRGNPWEGAQVTVRFPGGQVESGTDRKGTAFFPMVPDLELSVEVVLPNGLKVAQNAQANGDLFIEVPVCAPVPLLSNTELAVIVAGGVLVGAGHVLRMKALGIVGEIGFGGAVFSAIYRNSCSW